jgi:hypothetical protein
MRITLRQNSAFEPLPRVRRQFAAVIRHSTLICCGLRKKLIPNGCVEARSAGPAGSRLRKSENGLEGQLLSLAGFFFLDGGYAAAIKRQSLASWLAPTVGLRIDGG